MSDLIIGLDLGGTNIKGALIDAGGNIVSKKQVPTMADGGPQAVANRMARLAGELEAEAKGTGKKVTGMGVGVPGQLDRQQGLVVFSPNLHWHDVPLVEYLRRHLSIPIYIENDANVAALGEQWKGAGAGSLNMVMVTIGTGVGGGLILNGKLYTGANGSAGEVGHTVIEPAGPPCNCGRRGCLETLASATAMLRMAKEALDRGRESALARIEKPEARDIVAAAGAGDEVALEIVNTAAYYLGLGLANLINLFNPDTIVVGGGLSGAGEILFTPLIRTAMEWSLKEPADAVKIVPAKLGNDAGCLGAAALALR